MELWYFSSDVFVVAVSRVFNESSAIFNCLEVNSIVVEEIKLIFVVVAVVGNDVEVVIVVIVVVESSVVDVVVVVVIGLDVTNC